MPRETVTIPVSSLSPFEASAQFFGVLIHPLDAKKRAQLITAELHRQVREWAAGDWDWARTALSLPPLFMPPTGDRTERLHKEAMRIFDQERVIAAAIIAPFIAEAIGKARNGDGFVLQLREDGEPLGEPSFEVLGPWALRQQRRLRGRPDDCNRVTWETIRQRAWRYSKPVLHLALTFDRMLGIRNTTEERQAAWAALFNDRSETEKLLDTAEQVRHAILEIAQRTKRFRLSEKETVRVVVG